MFEYGDGQTVQRVAVADPGCLFSHWPGSLFSTDTTVTLSMDSNYDVKANFVSLLDAIFVDDDAPRGPDQSGEV